MAGALLIEDLGRGTAHCSAAVVAQAGDLLPRKIVCDRHIQSALIPELLQSFGKGRF